MSERWEAWSRCTLARSAARRRICAACDAARADRAAAAAPSVAAEEGRPPSAADEEEEEEEAEEDAPAAPRPAAVAEADVAADAVLDRGADLARQFSHRRHLGPARAVDDDAIAKPVELAPGDVAELSRRP